MPLSTQTKKQIISLLSQIESCSVEGDFSRHELILAPDIIVFAPGIEQHGREGFALCAITFEETEIKSEGVIAWVSGTCAYAGKETRFTAVLRGTGHAWELVLLHIS